MMDTSLNNAIINSIKETIKKRVDKEFDDYKYKCLKDLEMSLEAKRNDTVKSILDGIDVKILSQEPYSFEPVIQIKIEKRVYIKE